MELEVSTGAISEIIEEYRQKAPDIDRIRELAQALSMAKVTLPDASRGARFLGGLDEFGFDSKYLPKCLAFINKAGERSSELATAANRLIELETESRKPYDQFLLEFKAQLKAQTDLSENVRKLEIREIELNHSIHHLEKLNALQETINRKNITPIILETLIRDALRLEALGFTVQQAEILAKELAQRGLDPTSASAQIARVLQEHKDLEEAKNKAEAEANRWQLTLDRTKNETASVKAEGERLRDQLRKLEDSCRERTELLERQYRALVSKLQDEYTARKQELQTGFLTLKRENEAEIHDLQRKASELKTEVERSESTLESLKTNISSAEAQLQRIEKSISSSRILATVALLVENPDSVRVQGNPVEAMLTISDGFSRYLEVGNASWRNRPRLKEAVGCLSKVLVEEVKR